jgi:hypothetical protein
MSITAKLTDDDFRQEFSMAKKDLATGPIASKIKDSPGESWRQDQHKALYNKGSSTQMTTASRGAVCAG